MSEIKKIFITGGAGYVGAMLAPFLISKGYELTIYDLMIYGEDVIADNSKIKKITGDIRDIENVKKSMKGHDAVIHLACISNDPSFELNPNLGKSINLHAFEPMVKIARELNVINENEVISKQGDIFLAINVLTQQKRVLKLNNLLLASINRESKTENRKILKG